MHPSPLQALPIVLAASLALPGSAAHAQASIEYTLTGHHVSTTGVVLTPFKHAAFALAPLTTLGSWSPPPLHAVTLGNGVGSGGGAMRSRSRDCTVASPEGSIADRGVSTGRGRRTGALGDLNGLPQNMLFRSPVERPGAIGERDLGRARPRQPFGGAAARATFQQEPRRWIACTA